MFSFQAKQESLTTIWWWILHEIIASEDEGNRTEQPYKKANLSISTKKLDYWLFDDQRSLKLRYVYYHCVPTNKRGRRTDPAGRVLSVAPRILGQPEFFPVVSQNSKFSGGPLTYPTTLAAPGDKWCSEILGINSGQIDAK